MERPIGLWRAMLSYQSTSPPHSGSPFTTVPILPQWPQLPSVYSPLPQVPQLPSVYSPPITGPSPHYSVPGRGVYIILYHKCHRGTSCGAKARQGPALISRGNPISKLSSFGEETRREKRDLRQIKQNGSLQAQRQKPAQPPCPSPLALLR